MTKLAIATIAFNAPWAIEEQIRLFAEFLEDDHRLIVLDNSSDVGASTEIAEICKAARTVRWRVNVQDNAHHLALNAAAEVMASREEPFFGFVDHDVWPIRPTSLLPLIEQTGFLTVGQRHGPTGRFYGWPGFFFLSREWLGDRAIDFAGIRGEQKRDDGDTGSMNWPLFAGEDWERMYRLEHGYRPIREPDDYGLQSWGVEIIGDFIHASNTARWMAVPEPEERTRLIREMLGAL